MSDTYLYLCDGTVSLSLSSSFRCTSMDVYICSHCTRGKLYNEEFNTTEGGVYDDSDYK